MKGKIAALLALASAAGAGFGRTANSNLGDPEPAKKSGHAQFHDEMRAICRRGFVRTSAKNSARGYRSERPHIGKKATRAAKRAKVATMKVSGHYRGHNSPYQEGVNYLP